MYTLSKQLYNRAKKAGKTGEGLPWLRLAVKKETGGIVSTGRHIVKFIEDRLVEGRDYHTGKARKEVEYIFEENGEKKRYRVPVLDKEGNLHYFIRRMAEFSYGDTLGLEMKNRNNRNVVEFIRYNNNGENQQPLGTPFSEEEIPIIDDIPEDLPADSE